jgi:hypothetical protein
VKLGTAAEIVVNVACTIAGIMLVTRGDSGHSWLFILAGGAFLALARIRN